MLRVAHLSVSAAQRGTFELLPLEGLPATTELTELGGAQVGLMSHSARVKACIDPSGPIRLVTPRTTSLFRSHLLVEEGSRWLVELANWEPPSESWATPLQPFGRKGLWMLDFRDTVGEVELPTPAGPLSLSVTSWKLDDDAEPTRALEELLAAVWDRHLALTRRLGRAPSVELPIGARPRSPFQTLMLVDRLVHVDGVGEAWEALVAEPPSCLRIDLPIVPIGRARHPVLHGRLGPWNVDGGLDAAGHPQRVVDRRPRRSAVTPPALLAVKLARWVSDEVTAILGLLNVECGGAGLTGPLRTWASRARSILDRATALLGSPAFEELDPFAPLDLGSSALVLNRTCQPMLRAWTLLQQGVAPDGRAERLFRDPLKESFDLYEYWCWFALWDAVVDVVRPKDARQHWSATVERILSGERSLDHGLHARVESGDVRVDLWYNATANASGSPVRSYSLPFRPDLAMEIARPRQPEKPELILFDAKYRMDLVRWLDAEEEEEQRSGRAKSSDIKVMHGYRDALTSRGGDRPRWVLTIFPGHEVRLFAVDQTRSCPRGQLSTLACAGGGVGAVYAAPGRTEALRQCVEQLLAPHIADQNGGESVDGRAAIASSAHHPPA